MSNNNISDLTWSFIPAMCATLSNINSLDNENNDDHQNPRNELINMSNGLLTIIKAKYFINTESILPGFIVNEDVRKLNTEFCGRLIKERVEAGLPAMNILSDEKITELINNFFITACGKKLTENEIPISEKREAIKTKFRNVNVNWDLMTDELVDKLFEALIIDINNFIIAYQMMVIFKAIIKTLNSSSILPVEPLCTFYRLNHNRLKKSDGIHFLIIMHFIKQCHEIFPFSGNSDKNIFTSCFDFLKENRVLKNQFDRYVHCLKELSGVIGDQPLKSDDAIRLFCKQLDNDS